MERAPHPATAFLFAGLPPLPKKEINASRTTSFAEINRLRASASISLFHLRGNRIVSFSSNIVPRLSVFVCQRSSIYFNFFLASCRRLSDIVKG